MNKISFYLRYACGIYCLFNTYNGKRYIGSSQDIYNRMHEHLHLLKRNKGHNQHLQNAWNKYGEDAFEFYVLEYCKPDVRFIREQWYITNLQPEYNLTENVVANFGHPVSEEAKRKISETLKKRYAAGEIHTYRQDHAQVPCKVYNIHTCECLGSFKCIREACDSIQMKSNKTNYLYKRTYVVIRNSELETLTESLKDYFTRNFIKSSSSDYTYIITESPSGEVKYHFTIDEAASRAQSSNGAISKHLDATKEHPYIPLSGYKIYLSNTYYPFNAVQEEESPELLSGNIGKTPEMDNTEINSETKESESSYSVESETEKNITSPRVSDIQNG